jgi:hypothetical protein
MAPPTPSHLAKCSCQTSTISHNRPYTQSPPSPTTRFHSKLLNLHIPLILHLCTYCIPAQCTQQLKSYCAHNCCCQGRACTVQSREKSSTCRMLCGCARFAQHLKYSLHAAAKKSLHSQLLLPPEGVYLGGERLRVGSSVCARASLSIWCAQGLVCSSYLV